MHVAACMFADRTRMWWKTTMSRISYVTSENPGYQASVKIFHVFSRHFHFNVYVTCAHVFGSAASPRVDFRNILSHTNCRVNVKRKWSISIYAFISRMVKRYWAERVCFIRPIQTHTHPLAIDRFTWTGVCDHLQKPPIETIFFSKQIDSHCGYSIKANNNSSFIKCFSPFEPDKI